MFGLRFDLVCSLLIVGFSTAGQNYVVNSSFEDVNHDECGLFSFPKDFQAAVRAWTSPTKGIPNIHSSLVSRNCWNYVEQRDVRDGNRMASICLFSRNMNSKYRSYLQVELNESLQKNRKYYLEFWIKPSPTCSLRSSDIGFYFSGTKLSENIYTQLLVKPQLNFEQVIQGDDWTCLRGNFYVNEESKFMVIGNFFDDSHTNIVKRPDVVAKFESAFYYLDKIYVGAQ
jgi:hypothetical protein